MNNRTKKFQHNRKSCITTLLTSGTPRWMKSSYSTDLYIPLATAVNTYTNNTYTETNTNRLNIQCIKSPAEKWTISTVHH